MLCSTMKYSATSTLANRAFPFLLNGRFGGEEIIRRGQPSTGRCGQCHRQQRSSKHCWFDIEIHHHETYHRSNKYPLLLSFEKNLHSIFLVRYRFWLHDYFLNQMNPKTRYSYHSIPEAFWRFVNFSVYLYFIAHQASFFKDPPWSCQVSSISQTSSELTSSTTAANQCTGMHGKCRCSLLPNTWKVLADCITESSHVGAEILMTISFLLQLCALFLF